MKTKAAECSAAFFVVQNLEPIRVTHLFIKYILICLENAGNLAKFADFYTNYKSKI